MIPAYLSPLANHLWQSTLFAAAAGLLAVALRKNRAPVRYWLWLGASVKFLVPFSLLVSMGSQFDWRTARAAAPIQFPAVMDQISQPFALPASAPSLANLPAVSSNGPTVLLCAWLCGFLLVAVSWIRQWRRIRAAVRSASPMDLGLPIKVMSSSGRLEPGVFGILRPVLVLPKGIMDHLTPAQWELILAHELCHVRRRDNLTAAIHMAVEAVFWFYPLVWWIGLRLVDERERACDEEVLLVASDPHVYAEGILNVCNIYLESPLVCASGVSGSNLKKRIRAIMTRRIAEKLDFGRKLLLAAAAIAAIGGPIVFGLANAPQGKAQSKAAAGSPMAFEVASVRPSVRRASDGAFKSEDKKGRGPAFQVEHRRLTITNLNLFALIVHAYGVRGCRPFGGGNCALLSGGPDWLRKDGFDILAKMPDDAPDYTLTITQFQNGQAPQLQLMLQALLADRFHLQLHRERKQVPVFALTIGKKGPKFKKAEESEQPMLTFRPSVQSNGQEIIQLVVKNGSMQELADLYSKFMDRPVLDRTGLKDRYDLTMDYEANADAPGPFAAATGPGLFRAFQEAGLKLEATKGSVEVLVIDHAEHPSEN
jgi:bla regulator protein BlaR1